MSVADILKGGIKQELEKTQFSGKLELVLYLTSINTFEYYHLSP